MIKNYKNLFLTAIILTILSAPGVARQQEFNIIDLVKIVPFVDLVQNEEITSKNLLNLINNKSRQNNTEPSTPYIWVLKKYSKNTIIFHNEYEWWELHTYAMQENKQLLLVNTQLGNHNQSQTFSFFIYDKNTLNGFKKIKSSQFIPETIKENEFLTKDQKFSESIEENAVLYMNEDGTIGAAPWTWMATRWENKEPQYEIKFIWDKEKNTFIKIKERI
ncbi:hypothetical protein MNBD_GAMMA10-2340 [hydrothermal vent metagenome]|uniref:Uncharacterized protein n=1 Tax=hydrothermal vent metagenome TaxID=652676 RepID=A0A3B0Y000_9ZZZZ